MKLHLVVSPEAWSDVDDIAAFIGKDSPGSAVRFFDAAWASFEMLTEYPRVGPVVEDVEPEWEGLRKWAIHGFLSYLIFYRITDDRLEIARVLHGAMNLDRFFRGHG